MHLWLEAWLYWFVSVVDLIDKRCTKMYLIQRLEYELAESNSKPLGPESALEISRITNNYCCISKAEYLFYFYEKSQNMPQTSPEHP